MLLGQDADVYFTGEMSHVSLPSSKSMLRDTSNAILMTARSARSNRSWQARRPLYVFVARMYNYLLY